jgi:hypothetical protein
MKRNPLNCRFLCPILISIGATTAAAEVVLRNDAYEVRSHQDGSFDIQNREGDVRRFTANFTVLQSFKNPHPQVRGGKIQRVEYNLLTWGASDKIKIDPNARVEDGYDPNLDAAYGKGRTPDLFAAASKRVVLAAKGAEASNGGIRFSFDANDHFTIEASLTVPAGSQPPLVSYQFTPRQDGWYSVGYTGAPEVTPGNAELIWQPLIWNEKRFPDQSYLTQAFRATLPTTLVTQGGATVGVLAHPDEFPFMPLPTFKQNNPFGVAVRNAAGNAQPMLFAPVLGGERSQMKAGQKFPFRVMLPVVRGKTPDAFIQLSRSVYGFRDFRENVDVSLNETFENMVSYGMSNWSRFNDELRGCDYSTDAPGAVKNVSSLHPLSVALVTDNREIFDKRVRPIMESQMSREKFLFVTNPAIRIQNPSWLLKGPAAPISELGALYQISSGRTGAFASLAEGKFGKDFNYNLNEITRGDRWQNSLAMFRMTGESRWKERLIKDADAYLARRFGSAPTDFSDPDAPGMFFWGMFVPHWLDLLELYETTGEKRFLEASADAARRFTMSMWMSPAVPDGKVKVNESGRAPNYRPGKTIPVEPEEVDAWKLSEMALTPESAGTSKGHRAILNAHHAPYMMRLARLTGDRYFHDIARSAVVGRYTNFPGYHINTDRTTAFMKPDFPLRGKELNTTTSMHYNHPWPHAAMLLDYLVADAEYKSEGRIHFPSEHAEGYAYLQTKSYGHAPGSFYGDEDVWLWMPAKLVATDSIQVNYLSARGKGKLYLALTNQSSRPVDTAVRINSQLVTIPKGSRVSVRPHGGEAVTQTWDGQPLKVSLQAAGLTVITVETADVKTEIQQAIAQKPEVKWPAPVKLDVGGCTGMVMSFGPGLTSAYVYLEATFKVLKEVTLKYNVGKGWQELNDMSYPYDFTVPLADDVSEFRFQINCKRPNGEIVNSKEGVIQRTPL